MSLNVNWSDRLEALAEQLFEGWEKRPAGDPFAKTAIVVGDMATRNWLQDYFLFRRENTRTRKILANIDFVPLAEFVNDWLAAQTHKDARKRNANEHPYAKNVLAWRISALLSAGDDDPRLAPLYAYIGTNPELVARRGFELVSRIAQLYDDYIAYRPELLAAWEGGAVPDGVDAWQGVLYQKLVAQCPMTYSKDYAEALDESADLEVAYRNGFPRYEAVHVFDVAFAPKPFLDFLERISRKLPTTFWNFNPVRGTWDKKDLLLGALADNADGVLDYEKGVCRDGLRWIGSETNYATFRDLAKVETHVCHSPRRELEALRNGLQDFFAQNEYAQPKDVLVLCADWATYSPLVEAVFGTPGDAGYIPVALKGGIAEESPIKHAFAGLLDFKDNQFEVSAVVNLLSIPSVRRKFEIDVDELGLLRDMIQEANIHWGYDDEPGAEQRPFTWRRGLDRLALDALMGERENPDTLETAGALGRIRPCGHVEGDRATAVGKLDAFVRKLNELKVRLNGEYDFEGWRDVLTTLIDDFFAPDDAELEELSGFRRAVATAARDIRTAWYYAGIKDVTVSAEVYIAAVLSKIKDTRPHEPVSGDAVTFASLTSGAATPARFVWICGLNDGTFPKNGTFASFDFVGREPKTPFDVTPRDKDLFAFLKATFGARERLSLSYVGKNVRSNEDVPPSVSLVDFLEWFGKSENGSARMKRYVHPLQSYSPRYYLPGELPRNFSKADYTAAENLLKVAAGQLELQEQKGITAFPLQHGAPTSLDLEDVISFFKRPSTYLMRNRLRVYTDRADKDVLEDVEAMSVEIPSRYKIEIASSPQGQAPALDCEAMVEMGKAPDAAAAARALDELVLLEKEDDEGKAKVTDYGKIQRRTIELKDGEAYSCEANAVETLAAMKDALPQGFDLELSYGEHAVNMRVVHREVKTCGQTYVMSYDHYKSKDGETSPETLEMVLRHLAGHAGGNCFTSVVLRGDGTLRALLPIGQEEARSRMDALLVFLFEPLPPDLPDLNVEWKDDKFPQPLFVKAVEGLNFVKSAIKRGKAK